MTVWRERNINLNSIKVRGRELNCAHNRLLPLKLPASAMYSASQIDNVTVSCLFDSHEIAEPDSINSNPV